MKSFTRSVLGKVILFILTIIFGFIFIAGAAGISIMAEAGFYSRPYETVSDSIVSNIMTSDIDVCALGELMNQWYREPVDEYGSNLRYVIYNAQTGEVKSHVGEYTENGSSGYVPEGVYPQYLHTVYYTVSPENNSDFINGPYTVLPEEAAEIYAITYSLAEGLPVTDSYSAMFFLLSSGYNLRIALIPISIISFILWIVLFVILLRVTARRPDSDEVIPGPLNKFPYDLLLVISAFVIFFILEAVEELSFRNELFAFIAGIFAVIVCGCICLGLCVGLAGRIKSRTLLRGTLVFMVCRFAWRGARKVFRLFSDNLPILWKCMLVLVAISIVELILLAGPYPNSEFFTAFWVLEKLLLFPAAAYILVMMNRLKKTGEAIAAGDLKCETNTKYMLPTLKHHAENLSSLSNAINLAAEDKLRSERMKTELITNVSHDIKTPLTSIINYSDLICNEKCDNEKITEYSEVLSRQSQKLKRLIEDLIEASKASTGNLDVELSKCSASVFISQLYGEYEEKLASCDLRLVTKLTESPLDIMADGRRMQRITDNLINNICKYSLPGTRVYVDLTEEGENAVFTFRNTSKNELNISPEELMARFVRGDSSRSSEGNGLGLSIAQSLTQLQGGKMDIAIDGDLFKVTLKFPKV